MNIYETYRTVNKRIGTGEKIFFKQGSTECFFSSTGADPDNYLRLPTIGIYMGAGTSHSWLWFVDLFDRMGFYDLVFLDETHIRQNGLTGIDVLAISGGDTFAIAEGLGETGSLEIENFVVNGGLYIGSCAGAYLPLNSSKEHLNQFNFVNVKITNLTGTLPEAKKMAEKYCTPYGCSFIYHPVREEVSLRTTGIPPFTGMNTVSAPLYGGPALVTTNNGCILANYESFTDKTLFLVDEQLARETLIGKAAAVKTAMGQGKFYLFGPHFEHPNFPLANKLVADAIYWDSHTTARAAKKNADIKTVNINGKTVKNLLMDIRRELSNSRITAFGMEMLPVRWQIGNKIYEPPKIRVFIEAMWHRLKQLEKWGSLTVSPISQANIVKMAQAVTALLREMKRQLDKEWDTTGLAEELFHSLKILTGLFLQIYFNTARDFLRDTTLLTSE